MTVVRVGICLVAAIASSADAFSGAMAPSASARLALGSRRGGSRQGLSLRMGGAEGPDQVARRDAFKHAASALLAAGLAPRMAGAELNYDLPAEVDAWKGWSTTRTFNRGGKDFEIEQRFADNRQNGMAVYEGNEAMTEYMQKLGKPFFEGKSVLELGTGTGLGSLVAFELGARVVTATDRNPKVLDLANANFNRNVPDTGGRTLQTRRLNWGADQCSASQLKTSTYELGMCWSDIAGTKRRNNKYDVIIGSDLTYSEGVLPELIKCMKDFMHGDSQVLLVWCEPKLFTWNTDVMDRLNAGIRTFDKYFDAKILVASETYNGHPDVTIVQLKLNPFKLGYPKINSY
mmetsp:Transcript_4357/g.8540  ORF Transcript_4357/g.8540 Transcript_4357/m.8540 type:complete len:346 (-) Transcript_4357:105-1142(-)